METATRRRPAAAMAGHALALTFKQSQQDQKDAHAMTVFARLRSAPVKLAARMAMLAGLVGGRA